MPAGHVVSYRLWCRGGLREAEIFSLVLYSVIECYTVLYSVIQCYTVLYSVNKVKRPRPQGEGLKAEGGGLQTSLHGFSGGADVDPSSRRGSEDELRGPGNLSASFANSR
jgi:hypothetical protein